MHSYKTIQFAHHHILAGNYSIAVVKGNESYETIYGAFSAPFHEIDTLLDHGFIQMGESRYLIEVFFGGYMKVQFGVNNRHQQHCIIGLFSFY